MNRQSIDIRLIKVTSENQLPIELFDEIFQIQDFQKQPPVLIDIGASSQLQEQWKSIAKYSICIAFDADEREFSHVEQNIESFRQLHILHCIVTNQDTGESDFYLTKSPYCSSTLPPNRESLEDWIFSELFEVERKIRLKSRSLKSVMEELNLNYVDWFKTDSQGTDLRLFQILGREIISKILVADFEPGIIDAYQGEDKLFSVLSFMEQQSFWVSDLEIKGTHRVNKALSQQYSSRMKWLNLKTSPGWAEISYMNAFADESVRDQRSVLLGWVFATIKKQHGFALEILQNVKGQLDQELFAKIYEYSLERLFSGKTPTIAQRVKSKLIRRLQES